VICRGGNVFQGYLKQPDKTAETLIDGWLHSGDIGEMDDEGYVRIVDRKKELIITSGGKNISPANLEAALKTIPLIGQAAAIGDNRKFCSALLVLDPEAAVVWAKAHGKESSSLLELAADPEVIAEVQAGVDQVNQQFAQVEQIKKFVLIGEEWMPDSDMLTPPRSSSAAASTPATPTRSRRCTPTPDSFDRLSFEVGAHSGGRATSTDNRSTIRWIASIWSSSRWAAKCAWTARR
jgi:long-subunit acyl-CoA synthetase (AMP-forming)